MLITQYRQARARRPRVDSKDKLIKKVMRTVATRAERRARGLHQAIGLAIINHRLL